MKEQVTMVERALIRLKIHLLKIHNRAPLTVAYHPVVIKKTQIIVKNINLFKLSHKIVTRDLDCLMPSVLDLSFVFVLLKIE